MLSKKEIEKAKGWLSALDIKSEYEATNKEIILQYIEQLKSDKQNLIEKLEKDLNDLGEQTKDNYLREKANYTIKYLSEYRKILKGEKE